MPIDIRGEENFHALAAKIRAGVARNRLPTEMRAGFEQEAKPMREAVFRSIATYLPNRYAAVLRGSLDINSHGSVSGDTARVTLTARARGRHIGTIDAGNLRHPVFGRHRVPWVSQHVRRGFVTGPMGSRKRQLRQHVVDALHKFLSEITRG